MKILLSNNAEALRVSNPTHAVEAEFGDDCVEGSILTLAHHGPRANNPPPCLVDVEGCYKQIEERFGERDAVGEADYVIAVSHVDLDTLGGLMAILGCKCGPASFWEAAGGVDVMGPHRLPQIMNELPEECRKDLDTWLHAWWAWSQENRGPRASEVAEDISPYVGECILALTDIFNNDQDLLQKGEEFKNKTESLEHESFLVQFNNAVIGRIAPAFVNHLYCHGNTVAEVVVAFNPENGTVTVSRENDQVPVNCRDLVQALWGPEAGGHPGIAGSPRNRKMMEKDFEEALLKVCSHLSGMGV